MKRGFRDFHPAVCFVYYAGSLLLLLLMVHPFFTLSALVVLFAVNLLYDAGKRLLQLKSVILMTAGIILIVNPLTSERGAHILWEGMSHRITLEAVLYGGMMAGTVVGVIASFASYQQVISTHQFLYLFSRLLPQWALLTVLSLRFVPLMQRRLEEIMRVQRSREGEMSNFHFREQLPSKDETAGGFTYLVVGRWVADGRLHEGSWLWSGKAELLYSLSVASKRWGLSFLFDGNRRSLSFRLGARDGSPDDLSNHGVSDANRSGMDAISRVSIIF